jgi:hypothetical protein
LQGRPRYEWEDNINIDLREMDLVIWTGFIWLGLRSSG